MQQWSWGAMVARVNAGLVQEASQLPRLVRVSSGIRYA